MNIGLFGGSFDPIHLGHLLLAEIAREAANLDQVWFVPAYQSPLKGAAPQATPRQRLEMLRLAVAGYPSFRIYDGELKRKGTSYTVQTLETVISETPAATFSLIIGADSLADFPRWQNPIGILQQATVIAMNRGLVPASLESIRVELGETWLPRFQIVDMPAIGLSSTAIRERVRTGKSIRFQTPRAIEQYLLQHQPYSSGE